MINRNQINSLLLRAGMEMGGLLGKPAPATASERIAILLEADKVYDGSLVDEIRHLTEAVGKMENALAKALDERDVLEDEKRKRDELLAVLGVKMREGE